jgi:hypothetical protein
VFCGMKPSFGGLHMGLIQISLWVGLIRLVCTQGARVGPNQQIWIICTVTVENEHMVYIYVHIYMYIYKGGEVYHVLTHQNLPKLSFETRIRVRYIHISHTCAISQSKLESELDIFTSVIPVRSTSQTD